MASGLVRYQESRQGMAALLRSDGVRADLLRRGEKVADTGRKICPVRTGRYKASFVVTTGTDSGGAYVEVTNKAPYAVFLEFGTRHMQAQRIMGRALVAATG